MSDEVEMATIGSLGGLFQRTKHHAIPAGAKCDNCATELHGQWCYLCGQEYSGARRSIAHLLYEAFEGMFHADGRLWKTLPRLFLKPGQLTRDYIEGKKAPQAPPFSIYLVVVVLFVFVGTLAEKPLPPINHTYVPAAGSADAIRQAKMIKLYTPKAGDSAAQKWFDARAMAALADPERFRLTAESWEHRAAILMLPIAALLLSAIFVFQRRFYVYDHLVFSMHSLAFVGLVLTASTIVYALFGGAWAALLWLLLPVHLFVHMRGFYGSSTFGTLARMALLFVTSAIAFSLLLFALVVVSLYFMGS